MKFTGYRIQFRREGNGIVASKSGGGHITTVTRNAKTDYTEAEAPHIPTLLRIAKL